MRYANSSRRGTAARVQPFSCPQSRKQAGSLTSSKVSRAQRRTARCDVRVAAGNASLGPIAVTGATGLVGSKLVAKLAASSTPVRILTRDTNKAKSTLPFPNLTFYETKDWASAIPGCYGVVNLAGEPIATRWSDQIKREIRDSRINTTSSLVGLINNTPKEQRPKVLVSSSAVGYYGTSENVTFKEDSSPGGDFLADICKAWEAAAVSADTRVVTLRTGIVLSKRGGALAKMIPVFQIFSGLVGGPLGSGNQWMSWVHLDDLVDLFVEALRNSAMEGSYNATAPNPVRMNELCSSLGSVMGRPSWLPVPEFALQTLLGEGATVVLDGQKVLPAKALSQGFQFKYANVDEALKNLLR